MATHEDHQRALERWIRYEKECCLANTAHLTFISPGNGIPEPPPPAIAYPREALLEFRSAYVLLRNAVAELLDLDPETMTQMEVIVAVAKRKWAACKETGDQPTE